MSEGESSEDGSPENTKLASRTSGKDILFKKATSKEKTSKDLQLREASADDLGKICEWDEEAKFASTGSGFSDEKRESRREYLATFLEDARHEILIITSNEEKMGMLIYDRQPDPIDFISAVDESSDEQANHAALTDLLGRKSPDQERVHLISMAVDSEHRRKGVGSNALESLENKLTSQGVQALSFDTGVENKAMQQIAKGYTLFKGEAKGGYSNGRLVGVKLLNTN